MHKSLCVPDTAVDEKRLTVASTEATRTASLSNGEVNTPQLLLLLTVGSATTEKLPLPVKLAVARMVPLLVVLLVVFGKVRAVLDCNSTCATLSHGPGMLVLDDRFGT